VLTAAQACMKPEVRGSWKKPCQKTATKRPAKGKKIKVRQVKHSNLETVLAKSKKWNCAQKQDEITVSLSLTIAARLSDVKGRLVERPKTVQRGARGTAAGVWVG